MRQPTSLTDRNSVLVCTVTCDDVLRVLGLLVVVVDMAVQNVIGDSFRGATWVALHNGGGVGWYDTHTHTHTVVSILCC